MKWQYSMGDTYMGGQTIKKGEQGNYYHKSQKGGYLKGLEEL